MKKIWKISLGTAALLSPLSMVVACGKTSDTTKKDVDNTNKQNDDSVSNLKNALDGIPVYTLQDVANTQAPQVFNENVLNTFGFTVTKFPSADLLNGIAVTYQIKDGADADKKIIEVTMTKGEETGIINLNLSKLKDENAINTKIDEVIRARLGSNERLKPFLEEIITMGNMRNMINKYLVVVEEQSKLSETQLDLFNKYRSIEEEQLEDSSLTTEEKEQLKKEPFVSLIAAADNYTAEGKLFITALTSLSGLNSKDMPILLPILFDETIRIPFLMSGKIAQYKMMLEKESSAL